MGFFEDNAANMQFLGIGLMLGGAIAAIETLQYGGVAIMSFGFGGLTVELLTGHKLSEVNASK